MADADQNEGENMMNRARALAVGVLLAAAPRLAWADVVWPALLLETRVATWWAVLIGLLVEWPVVAWLLSASWKRSLVATIVANAASTLLGIVLLPLSGIALEIFPGFLLYNVFNVGTFNPVTWTATVLGGAVINAGIELLVLRRFFGPVQRRRPLVVLMGINLVSVGAAMASILVSPPRV